jgi:hypothetical protein
MFSTLKAKPHELVHVQGIMVHYTKRDRMGWSGLDWIDMAQDRDQWRALVNTVLNLRVP